MAHNGFSVTVGSYKGHPTITLRGEGKREFTFGLSKAEMILGCQDDIARFVAQHTRLQASNGPTRLVPYHAEDGEAVNG